MREIKFRIWNGKDLNYNPIFSRDWTNNINTQLNERINEYGFILQQYTGLKDKNGKDIYEGDIIKHCMGGSLQDYPSEVIWNDDGGWSPWLEYCRDNYTTVSEPEVVGNIYESPELLKITI